jgi:hypothetical protein
MAPTNGPVEMAAMAETVEIAVVVEMVETMATHMENGVDKLW